MNPDDELEFQSLPLGAEFSLVRGTHDEALQHDLRVQVVEITPEWIRCRKVALTYPQARIIISSVTPSVQEKIVKLGVEHGAAVSYYYGGVAAATMGV